MPLLISYLLICSILYPFYSFFWVRLSTIVILWWILVKFLVVNDINIALLARQNFIYSLEYSIFKQDPPKGGVLHDVAALTAQFEKKASLQWSSFHNMQDRWGRMLQNCLLLEAWKSELGYLTQHHNGGQMFLSPLSPRSSKESMQLTVLDHYLLNVYSNMIHYSLITI